MFKNISNRLLVTQFFLLLILSSMFIGMVFYTAPLFLQELNQRLNLDLAANIVKEKKLILDKKVNHDAMTSVLNGMMLVNPSIEIYITDPSGKIMAFSAPKGAVKKSSINMPPVHQFLNNEYHRPVLGDDPRSIKDKKVFSVAPIKSGSRLDGYLYIVLAGQAYSSVFDLLEKSYLIRSWFIVTIISFLVALVIGFILFRYITRRIDMLLSSMETFKKTDFTHSINLPDVFDGKNKDEIDRLATTFLQMSERIIQQVKILKHNDSSRRELIANVSHDLRTPLASLQGYLETLLLKEESLTDDEKREYIKTAFDNSQRLQKLISELFELASLENDNAQCHFESFSMSELAHDVSQKFKLKADSKNIKIQTSIPEVPAFVSADIGLIQRVLENLIDNAIKYTPNGGSVEIALQINESKVATIIKDSGQGISEHDSKHIFERFYRIEKHRDQDGSGLGLAIVKRIIQLHDSSIFVSGSQNKGAEFTFSLPHVTA
ncbi:MAG: HAMP domain-containing sensor histidine kinase [Woeseiaceae bacterium]